jgi:uncharacterized protein (TIGR02466 family)
MEIAHLFSTPVFGTTIQGGLPQLEKVKTYEYIALGGDRSRNVYMTENLSVLDDFPEEKEIILSKFNEVKNNYLRHTDTKFAITRSWGTKAEKNSYSEYHRHGNNYYSGVFYLDNCTADSAPIEFYTPLDVLSSYEIESEDYNVCNMTFYSLNPDKNTLIFFPSYLKHKIGTHLSDTPRHSIAFNIHPVGKYGMWDSTVNVTGFE